MRLLRLLFAPRNRRPQTLMHLPAIDHDGDRAWIDSVYAPTPADMAMALHPDERVRAFYAVKVVTQGRAQAVRDTGYKMGWKH
jgi:hypothetical protein